MNPIKPPQRYADLADPQVRPRFTGVPTFFRLPYAEELAGSISASSACRSTAG